MKRNWKQRSFTTTGLSVLETQEVVSRKEFALCFHHGVDNSVSPQSTPAVCALTKPPGCTSIAHILLLAKEFGN